MLRQAQSLVSGTTPELSKKLKTWVKGLLIEVKISLIRLVEILSKLLALLDRKVLQILTTSCSETLSKYKELIKSSERKWRCDFWDTGMFLARLGPISVKYLQNCSAICLGSEIISLLSNLDNDGNVSFEIFFVQDLIAKCILYHFSPLQSFKRNIDV